MESYDIAVVGAGPAGAMAAIRAAQLNKKVVLLEKNDSIGKKILLTGKGRCNLTNVASVDDFIEKFGKNGVFLRSAFSRFFNEDLIEFFKAKGLDLKIERQGRVFPCTDRAVSVLRVLRDYLLDNNVSVLYSMRIKDIKRGDGFFQLHLEDRSDILSKKVILATGGVSFKATGSTGDGLRIARGFGHKIIPLRPGLVPLRTKEGWVRDLQGLTLKNIRLVFHSGRKKIVSEIGELLFTHFGVSGPLVLDLSSEVVCLLESNQGIFLSVDLKPALTKVEIEERLLREVKACGNTKLRNILKEWLPAKLIPVFIKLSGVNADKKANQLSKDERRTLVNLFKDLSLTVIGSLPIEEAMVTCGGVALDEINPQTMESRVIPGLYFAGEILDTQAPSGGYNLQQAFSTGYLAGEQAGCAK